MSDAPLPDWRVDAVLTGRIAVFADDGSTSAIAKHPVDGRRRVTRVGIDGDEQADLSVHGGVDKAIHHYPFDHYPAWRDGLGHKPLLSGPGAFGENISTLGLTEATVCLGDRFWLGTALVEIAQGRQPCWKQGHFLQSKSVVAEMVRSGRTGWYYRLIEEGEVTSGDRLKLTARPFPQWPIARVFALVIAGRHGGDAAALNELANMPVLASGWRERAGFLAARLAR